MGNHFAAEAMKFGAHKATWFLVWILPAGALALFLITIPIELANVEDFSRPAPAPLDWIRSTLLPWQLLAHSVGAFLVSAFAAFVFAAEYGWNTFRLVLPNGSRARLVAAKYMLIVASLAIAYILAAAVTVGMTWVEDVLTGDGVPGGITAADLLREHGKAAAASAAPALLAIAYTSLAAVLTRSAMAGFAVGIGVTILQDLFLEIGAWLGFYLPGTVWLLFEALPAYHLPNLAHWIENGTAFGQTFPDGRTMAAGWPRSLLMAIGWIAGLASLTLISFQRQDIN